MQVAFRAAVREDADQLIQIYNAAFYSDYVRYGACPAYGRSREMMEESIAKTTKYLILCDQVPVGVVSYENRGDGEYYLGCLCVIPEYQGRGLGSRAFRHMCEVCADWRRITLVTPVDKEENVRFYTEKCGFSLGDRETDGNVELIHFEKRRGAEEGTGSVS